MTDLQRGLTAEHDFEAREHRDLARGLDRIHDVGLAVGSVAAPDLSLAMLDLVDWVEAVLLPHVAWEETWLYPEFERRAGTPWATRTMAHEHHQLRELARRIVNDRERLGHEPSRSETAQIRADLFGFEAVLRAHIEKEERFLQPLLVDPGRSESAVKSSATG